MANYRKIWSDHYGPIPKDEKGRSYEIHHIDGNRDNNDISNLAAVSIDEHYQIHFDQGDWAACALIVDRVDASLEELTRLSHHLGWPPMEILKCPYCQKEGTKPNMLRWHFENCPEYVGKSRIGPPQTIVVCPHCKKSGGHSTMKRYHFDRCKHLTGKIHEFLICPHCKKEGYNARAMKHYHFDNCPQLTGQRAKAEIVTCPHCNTSGGKSNMKRYHFDKCKNKQSC